MKKSALVTLVLSGALVGGCDDRPSYAGYPPNTPLTNNTYVNGLGYYHAPYHGWFQYPYNFYRPGFGYYHGGLYTPDPFASDISVSVPSRVSGYGGHASGSGFFGGGSSSSSSVSRGGFGSTGHGGFGE